MKLIDVMDTSFRDGLQSVYGARVLWQDLAAVVQKATEAGIEHFEFGGGARFQSLYFYLNEDAFNMMDNFRAIVGPKANLQTLSRGVNTLALDTASSDIIRLHAKLFAKHGASTIRNFDALNDPQNLIHSAKCIKEYGLKHELCVTLMHINSQAAHTAKFYEQRLRAFLDAGIEFDSICFKDASGTSSPKKVYETIKRARALLGKDVHIRCHTHDSAGVAVAVYLAALEAGADGIDLAAVPVSAGTSQPDILTMIHALRGSEFDLGLDERKIIAYEREFEAALGKYFLPPESVKVNPLIVYSPMPGGAMSANTQMMRDNGLIDRLDEVIAAMQEVVECSGYGTSVTPVSQFYFQQALNNVLFGKWKKIAPGFGRMVLGYFGTTPIKPNDEIIQIAKEQLNLEPTNTPALELADKDPNKSIAHFEGILRENNLAITDENIFILACCDQKGLDFLKGKAKVNIRLNKDEQKQPTQDSGCYDVSVNGKTFNVQIKPSTAAKIEPTTTSEVAAAPKPSAHTESGAVISSMPGSVYKVLAKVGDKVKIGDELFVLEAMKMELSIEAQTDGVIEQICVKEGQIVSAKEVLAIIKA